MPDRAKQHTPSDSIDPSSQKMALFFHEPPSPFSCIRPIIHAYTYEAAVPGLLVAQRSMPAEVESLPNLVIFPGRELTCFKFIDMCLYPKFPQ